MCTAIKKRNIATECKRNERRNWNTKGKKKLIMHELFFNKMKKKM